MTIRIRSLAWIAAISAVLIVAGLTFYPGTGRIRTILTRHISLESSAPPVWSGMLERAEEALAQGYGDEALVEADSAWRLAVSQQDSSHFDVLTISRRDSVPTRIYWRDAAEAESLIVRIRSVREAALGADHPDLAFDWEDLANLYDRRWRHHESLPFYKRMLEIRENSLDPLHPDVDFSVMRLANHCRHLGRYPEAETLFRRGIEIRKSLYGSKIHESDEAACLLSKAYDELGHVCSSQGRYAEAERAYRVSLDLRESTYGTRHPEDVGASMGYLGGLYWTLGQRAKAQAFFEKSLQMREAGLEPDHADIAASLSSLAMVRTANREYQEAERLYRRALDIRKRTLGKDTPGGAHPGIAMSLNSLGWIHTCQGRYADAEKFYLEADDIWRKAFGEGHPRSVGVLEDLGYNRMKAGDYEAAAEQYGKACRIISKTLGPDHPRMADVLEAFGALLRLEDRAHDAMQLAERAVKIRQANFKDNALILEEGDALSFARSLAGSRNAFISCISDAGVLERKESDIADIVLATKGPVSDEIFERLRVIESEADSATLALKQKLRDAKFELSNLWMEGSRRDAAAHRANVDRIEREIEDLEKEIADVASGRREVTQDPTWRTVSRRLPTGAALIEYLRWEYRDPETETSIPKYLALILRKGTDPEVIMLGDAASIEDAVGDYRSHMGLITSKKQWPSAEDRQSYAGISETIYRLILKPVESLVDENTILIIAPDGVLNSISFAGLITDEGHYLIESHRLLCVDSGRDLARPNEHAHTGKGLLVMADPALGHMRGETEVTSGEGGATSSYVRHRSGDYGAAAGEYLHHTSFLALPDSRKEAERVAAAWSETCSEPLALYIGDEATEECFKAKAPGKRVVHLATHGFSLPLEGESQANTTGHSPINVTNPLLMSGLILAGAKTDQATPGKAVADDGILTAYEVSAMDLTGVDLVVLSACETGLGTMAEGEGVYGLRRAFQYAGARTVISTLWSLSDEAAAGIMSRIYTETESPLPERLRSAQLEMLATLRSKGEPDHPYSWACLTLTGTLD